MYRLGYAFSFLLIASVGAVFAVLSDIQDQYALPDWGIGLIVACGFLTVLPTTFLGSPLADRGYAGPLVLSAAVLAVIANLIFGFGDTLWHFVLSRGMLGAAVGLGGIGVKKAIIGIDVAGSGKKLGALLSAFVAGFLLGPSLAAQLVRFGFATPFVVLAVATAIVAVPLTVWVWGAPVSTSRMTVKSVVRLLERPAVQASVLGYTVFFGSIGIFDSTVDIYLDDIGATDNQFSLVILFIGLPFLVMPPLAGDFIERSDTRRIFVIAATIGGFTLAGYGLVPSLIAFSLAGFVHSTVESFIFPGAQIIVVNETGASEAAAGQALLEAAGAVSGAATALVGPVLYDAVGARALFGGYGLLLFCTSFVLRRWLRADHGELAPAEPIVV